MKDNIIIEIDKLIEEKFGNYSKYIIQERALPNLRDGLKPVQRRILFAMYSLNLSNNNAYKKSARVVGDVIGKYHPHGDSSVYDAMVRLGQEWKLNVPLVEMHGNKGSIDGDSPAAMRYTEVRLSKISKYLLQNIDKNITPFSNNFDDTEIEPIILPSIFPNLIVNGSTGIASGYSTNIPPHNFNEVIDALVYVVQNIDAHISDENIFKIIRAPDFPTGGIVYNINDIREAYRTGKGQFKIRAKIKYNSEENSLRVYEVPYETNKSELVRKIDILIRTNKLPGIAEIRDDSDKKGLQVSLLLHKGADRLLIKKYLYKKTDLEKSYKVNMVAIKDKKPTLLSLREILMSFSEHLIHVYTNLYKHELDRSNAKKEIIDGLIKVVSILDEVIAIIRSSKNKAEATRNLMTKFIFTEIQATAIVNLRLYRLTSTDITKLENEQKILQDNIDKYNAGLYRKEYLTSVIINDIKQLGEEFNYERRTSIVEKEIGDVNIREEDLIRKEKVIITITKNNMIRKVIFNPEKMKNDKVKRGDSLIFKRVKSNMKNIIIFTSFGRYYSIPIFKLTTSNLKDVGQDIKTLFNIKYNEKIIDVFVGKSIKDNFELLVSSKNGKIKRISLGEINLAYKKSGSKYTTLKDIDEVVSVDLIDTTKEYSIVVITNDGYGLKYDAKSVPLVGYSSIGISSIKLNNEAYVISTFPYRKSNEDSSKLFIVSKSNNGKKLWVSDIKLSARYKKGVKLYTDSKSIHYGSLIYANVVNIYTKIINIYILSKTNELVTYNIDGNIGHSGIESKLSNLNINKTIYEISYLRYMMESYKKSIYTSYEMVENGDTEIDDIKAKKKSTKTISNILDKF